MCIRDSVQGVQDFDVRLGHAVFAGSDGNAAAVIEVECVSASLVPSCLLGFH